MRFTACLLPMTLLCVSCATAPSARLTTCPSPIKMPALDPLPAAAQTSFIARMQQWLSGSLETLTSPELR